MGTMRDAGKPHEPDSFANCAPLRNFAALCFGDDAIREYAGKNVLARLEEVRNGIRQLDEDLLSAMSRAIRDWALKMGATHYMHWFQPLTMHVAGKQYSLLKIRKDGPVYDLSSKDLLFGESDASSLPSGGLRSTFEARGVLRWDFSSFAFIRESGKGRILYIPTRFMTFNGQSLDLKTPLLASMESLKKHALPLVNLVNRALGKREVGGIQAMAGPEQEFFLIDKGVYERRPDLKLAGRTVMGSVNAIGEFSTEHYYGGFSERVQGFMQDLNRSLYRIGIIPETQHREAAPNQFEIALRYDECNIISDKNLIMQEIIVETAGHYGLAALFAEKPFAGVNGSGKHTNWSLQTDDGENIFSPGKSKEDAIRFLFFTSVLIAAIDEFQDLIRCSAASYSNDMRLSKGEAPPCIMSVYLGEDVTCALSGGFSAIKNAGILKGGGIRSDRNRTSPIAFTGNKFEFRPLGSSQSISVICSFINSAFSFACKRVLDEIGSKGVGVDDICRHAARIYYEHSKAVYNDNCYSKEWKREAARRGLERADTTLCAVRALTREKNVAMFEEMGVFSRQELESRQNVMISSYVREVMLDACVLSDMIRRSVIPVIRDEVCRNRTCHALLAQSESEGVTAFEKCFSDLVAASKRLDAALDAFKGADEYSIDDALKVQSQILPAMEQARAAADALERDCDRRMWPFPSYDEILCRV